MLNLLLIIFSALFIPGLILRTRSILSGRKGPGLFQPWRDVIVLLRKGRVVSHHAGAIFRVAPSIQFTTVMGALLVLPFGGTEGLLSFNGDIIFVVYLLALGRFFMVLAAMDTASGFSAMGANREVLYALLAEPALLLIMGVYVMTTGVFSFSSLIQHTSVLVFQPDFLMLAALFLFVQLALVETCRVPVDDPKTHLELTMVHEVMVLDYSGPDLAVIHLTTWMKFALFGNLIANCILPSGWGLLATASLYLLIQLIFAMIIGFIESFRARNKIMQNPKFILTLTAVGLATFAILLVVSKTGGNP